MNHFVKFFFIFGTICNLVTSAPAPTPTIDSETSTPAAYETNYVAIANHRVWFLDFFKVLPPSVVTIWNNLNATQKEKLVELQMKMTNVTLNCPLNFPNFDNWLRENLPTVYPKIVAINHAYYNKWLKLKPETKTLLRGYRTKAMELFPGPDVPTREYLQKVRDFTNGVLKIKDEPRLWEELETQFPYFFSFGWQFKFWVRAGIYEGFLEEDVKRHEAANTTGTPVTESTH